MSNLYLQCSGKRFTDYVVSTVDKVLLVCMLVASQLGYTYWLCIENSLLSLTQHCALEFCDI